MRRIVPGDICIYLPSGHNYSYGNKIGEKVVIEKAECRDEENWRYGRFLGEDTFRAFLTTNLVRPAEQFIII